MYSGVTNTKASKRSMVAAQRLVCSLLYSPSEGGTGSSSRGRS